MTSPLPATPITRPSAPAYSPSPSSTGAPPPSPSAALWGDAPAGSSRPLLLPVDLAADGLDAHMARDVGRGHGLYVAVLMLLVAGGAALPVVRVQLWAQAPGIVRPEVEKHEVRSPRAGVAARVLVREHQRVRIGEPLLALDPRPAKLRAAALDVRVAAARDAVHDLTVLARRDPSMGAAIGLATARYRDEWARFAAVLDEARVRQRAAAAMLERTRALAGRGYATRAELDADAAALATADAAVATLRERQGAEWQGALADARATLAALRAEAAELDAERAALVVRAPVAGTVEQLARLGAGSFVQGGEVVAVISPERALVAELHVAPRDVMLLQVGSRVRLEVDAFDPSDWGLATGRVVAVADDYMEVDGRPTFRVRCALDATELVLPGGVRGRIRKGMTVRARFPTARRTLWQILSDDVGTRLDPTRSRSDAHDERPRGA